MSIADELEKDIIDGFMDAVHFSQVAEFAAEWSSQNELSDLTSFIQFQISEERGSQLKRFSEGVKVVFTSSTGNPLIGRLETDRTWARR